jgi:hypothetical protein
MSPRAKDWADRWVRAGIRRLDDAGERTGRRAPPSVAAVLRELAKLSAERPATTAGDEKRPNLDRQRIVEHCWFRYDTLAGRAGCSEATVPRALDRLNDAGLVLRKARYDRRGWVTCTDFFLNVNDEPIEQFAARLGLMWCRAEKSTKADSQPEPQNEVQEGRRLTLILQPPDPQNEVHYIKLTPDSESGNTPHTPKGAECDLFGCTSDPRSVADAERDVAPQGTDAEGAARSGARAQRRGRARPRGDATGPTEAEIQNGFADWYAAYPRKVDKADAKRAYTAIVTGRHRDPECRATIPQLLAALKACPFPDEQRFIKHPATWLNKGAWMDFVADATGDALAAEVERMLAGDYGRRLIREMGAEQARIYVRDALSKSAEPTDGTNAAAA